MSNCIRFKVDFQFRRDTNPEGFWFVLDSEDRLTTVADLKARLITDQKMSPMSAFDVYLQNYLLHDSTKLSVIRDNDTIVLKNQVIVIEDESVTPLSPFMIKRETTEDSAIESSSVMSEESLPPLSPIIGLTIETGEEEERPPQLTPFGFTRIRGQNRQIRETDKTVNQSIKSTADYLNGRQKSKRPKKRSKMFKNFFLY